MSGGAGHPSQHAAAEPMLRTNGQNFISASVRQDGEDRPTSCDITAAMLERGKHTGRWAKFLFPGLDSCGKEEVDPPGDEVKMFSCVSKQLRVAMETARPP